MSYIKLLKNIGKGAGEGLFAFSFSILSWSLFACAKKERDGISISQQTCVPNEIFCELTLFGADRQRLVLRA